MKKISIILTSILFMMMLPATAFSQESELSESISSNSPGFSIFDFRLGLTAGYSPVFGEMKNYINGNFGGGVSTELDILPFLGAGIFVDGNINPVISEKLKSVWNLHAGAKLYGRFNVISDLYLQPELGYGVILYFPQKAANITGNLNKCYADQLIQIGVGIRYAPQSILNGALEIEICPYYILSPENGAVNNFAGGRIGIYYSI